MEEASRNTGRRSRSSRGERSTRDEDRRATSTRRRSDGAERRSRDARGRSSSTGARDARAGSDALRRIERQGSSVRSTQLTPARDEWGGRSDVRTRDRERERDRGERDSRGRGAEGRSRDGRRGGGAAQRPQRGNGTLPRVPLPLTIVACVLCVALSILGTRCSMQPQIKEAQQEAKDAQRELADVTRELNLLKEEARESESSKSATTATASTEGVESPWTSTGRFTTGDTTLDTEVKDFCDQYGPSTMSRDEATLEVYKTLAWADYVERDNAQHPSGADWRNTYAHQYYENDCSGNCYEFAAFLMYCLRYMGYDDAMAEGIEIELESGNWGDHGIVFLTDADGNDVLCDTARGTDAFMVSTDIYNYRIVDFETA